jgi:hypothetical protein
MCTIKAAVEVLPLLPVTATKVAPLRFLAWMARHFRNWLSVRRINFVARFRTLRRVLAENSNGRSMPTPLC